MAIFLSSVLVFVSCLITTELATCHKEETVVLETKTCNIEGTLTVPETDGKIPLLIIIAGSGPTDRDCNSQGLQSNTYKYLAENLFENGIATLRYDKRFIGKSLDTILKPIDLTFDIYINDAQGWVDKYKNDERFSDIIILGHSEGSVIGGIVSQNENVDKFISIAGPGNTVDKILKEQLGEQSESVLKYATPIIDSLAAGHFVNNVPPGFIGLFNKSVQPFLISWMKIDPCQEIAKVHKPVLIIQGTTDIQVSVKEAELLKQANKNAELVIIDGMNHIMKDAEADRMKNLATYYDTELPVNQLLIETIIKFIKEN